jgi:hypothetical protein
MDIIPSSSNPMYIAGLYLSHAQGIESMVCLTTVTQIVIAARQHRAAIKRADSEGGSIVKLPESFAGRIVTPIHAAAVVVPTLVYVGSVIINGLVQPSWIERWRLPEVGVKEEAWARTAACVAALGISKFMGTAYNIWENNSIILVSVFVFHVLVVQQRS